MVATALASYFLTPKLIHEKNKFSFAPIVEVADSVRRHLRDDDPRPCKSSMSAGKDLGVERAVAVLLGQRGAFQLPGQCPNLSDLRRHGLRHEGIPAGTPAILAEFLKLPGAAETLAAICCGSVFMGANTYIGNGPNFMVKAIAEENGVKMPSFFGYMAYSGGDFDPASSSW